jgi:hypothetical protein
LHGLFRGAFLVLGALLEAALRHVAIDLGTAQVRPRAHQVDGGLLAALERTDDFVDHAVVDQRLQAGRGLHGYGRRAGPWIKPAGGAPWKPAAWSMNRFNVPTPKVANVAIRGNNSPSPRVYLPAAIERSQVGAVAMHRTPTTRWRENR